MRPQPEQTLQLLGAQGRHLGRVALERAEEGLLEGTFTPGPDYAAVQSLFRAFEEAVDSQALSAVDRLGAMIESLGLQVRSQDGAIRSAVHDVQIWGDRAMTCRLGERAQLPLNGTRATSQVTRNTPMNTG